MDKYIVEVDHDQIMKFVDSQPVLPFIMAPDTTNISPKDFVLLGNVYVAKEVIQFDYRIYYILEILISSMVKYEAMNVGNLEFNNNFFTNGQMYVLSGYNDISCFGLSSVSNDNRIVIVYNKGIIEIYKEK